MEVLNHKENYALKSTTRDSGRSTSQTSSKITQTKCGGKQKIHKRAAKSIPPGQSIDQPCPIAQTLQSIKRRVMNRETMERGYLKNRRGRHRVN